MNHIQATWERHENSMIDAQLQLGDLKLVLEAAQKAEAEAKIAKESAESQLMSQSSELDRLRSRMAGAAAEMNDLRSQARALLSQLYKHFVLDSVVWERNVVCLTTQVSQRLMYCQQVKFADKQMTTGVVLVAYYHLCRALTGMDMHYRQYTHARPVFDGYTTINNKQDCLC